MKQAAQSLMEAASRTSPEDLLAASSRIEPEHIGPDCINEITMAIVLCTPEVSGEMARFLKRPGVALAIAEHLPPPHNRQRAMRVKTLSCLLAAGVSRDEIAHVLDRQGAAIRNHFARVMAQDVLPQRDLASILSRKWNGGYFAAGYSLNVAYGMSHWGLEAYRSLFVAALIAVAGAMVCAFLYPMIYPNTGKLELVAFSAASGVGSWILYFILNRILDHL